MNSTRNFITSSGGMYSSVTNAGTSFVSSRINAPCFAGSFVPGGSPSGQLQRREKEGEGRRENTACRVNSSSLMSHFESNTQPTGSVRRYLYSMMLPTITPGSVKDFDIMA